MGIRRWRQVLCFSGMLGTLLVARSSWSHDPHPAFTLIRPTPSAGRYLTIHESETLRQWRYNVGAYFDYGRKPIQLQDLITGNRFDVVRDQLTATVTGALGLTDWLEIGLSIPVTLYESHFDPTIQSTPPFGNAPKQISRGLGDIRVESKFRLLDIDRLRVGVAVVPFINFPTGKRGTYIGNETYTGGGKLVVEGNIQDRVWLSGNVGYQYVRRSHQYFARNANAIYDDLLSFGLGTRVRISDDWALLGEALTQTNVKDAFRFREQTPIELLAGGQWTPQKWSSWRGFGVTLMGGAGVTRGVGAAPVQVVLGVNYRQPKIVSLAEPRGNVVEARVEEKIVITQRIHFEFNRSVIRPVSYPILDDVAELLRRNPQIHRVQVEGHTDWIGGDLPNQRLSERRARAVVDYLIKRGAESSRLIPIGYGKTRPIADNHSTEGRAKNRRTEFTVVD